MPWPAVANLVLGILGAVGGSGKDEDSASKVLKIGNLIGDYSSQNKKKKKKDNYGKDQTFNNFLSSDDSYGSYGGR